MCYGGLGALCIIDFDIVWQKISFSTFFFKFSDILLKIISPMMSTIRKEFSPESQIFKFPPFKTQEVRKTNQLESLEFEPGAFQLWRKRTMISAN